MGRTQAEVEATIASSVCFGGHVDSRLVAFGRIFEKPAGTAFLADVFVLPPWRGLGYGRAIVKAMVAYIDGAGYTLAALNTRDAVGLYEKFGFALTGVTPTAMKRERPRTTGMSGTPNPASREAGSNFEPVVRRFAPEEWPTYRALRLRSLADSPDAFGRTLAEEETRSNDDWAERLRSGCESGTDLPLLAVAGSLPVGLAWGRFSDPANSKKAHLFQMWVDPHFRRRGVGRALLDAVVHWAQDSGADCLMLGVTCDTPAMRLYEKRGFIPDGERNALREGSALFGQPMRLPLGSRP